MDPGSTAGNDCAMCIYIKVATTKVTAILYTQCAVVHGHLQCPDTGVGVFQCLGIKGIEHHDIHSWILYLPGQGNDFLWGAAVPCLFIEPEGDSCLVIDIHACDPVLVHDLLVGRAMHGLVPAVQDGTLDPAIAEQGGLVRIFLYDQDLDGLGRGRL